MRELCKNLVVNTKLSKILNLDVSTELIIPIVLIALYVIFLVALKGTLPSTEELVSHAASLYARFGYEIIFTGAFLEALIIVNIFAPGAFTVGLGAVFARAGEINLTVAVIAAILGSMLAYVIDYYLGYYGLGNLAGRLGLKTVLVKTGQNLEKNRFRSFALGFFHPDFGSVVALAAGSLKINFSKFIFLAGLSTIAWYSLWGIVIFSFGSAFLTILVKHFWVLILLMVSAGLLTTIYGKVRE